MYKKFEFETNDDGFGRSTKLELELSLENKNQLSLTLSTCILLPCEYDDPAYWSYYDDVSCNLFLNEDNKEEIKNLIEFLQKLL